MNDRDVNAYSAATTRLELALTLATRLVFV